MTAYLVFTLIGVLCSVLILVRFLYFIYPYLKSSSLKSYLSSEAYALVTGATDGIGKAIAQELALRGFNIILHGRSPAKLSDVENEIKAKNSKCKVLTLVHDGSKNSQFNLLPIKDVPITILVNNVGIGPIGKFTDFSNEAIEETITLNVSFPTQLTRNILPLMSGKSLVLNVSSYAGLIPPPFLAVYAGTKAYNNAFSISLQRELDGFEIISLITGSVNTGSNKKAVTFLRPNARKYAKSVLSIIGCGRKSIMPY